jgi:hypothetical protein
MENEPTTDLSTVTTKELIEELLLRSPAIIVAACMPDDNDECETCTWHAGNSVTCLGLSSLMLMTMKKHLNGIT